MSQLYVLTSPPPIRSPIELPFLICTFASLPNFPLEQSLVSIFLTIYTSPYFSITSVLVLFVFLISVLVFIISVISVVIIYYCLYLAVWAFSAVHCLIRYSQYFLAILLLCFMCFGYLLIALPVYYTFWHIFCVLKLIIYNSVWPCQSYHQLSGLCSPSNLPYFLE